MRRRARLSPWIGLLLMATVAPAHGAAATVPGENGKIAFVSDRDGNREIYLMDADGTGPVNLSNSPATEVSPTWSPDGRKIAFTTDRDGNNEIYVMNADGTDPVNLTNDPANDAAPTWSPDGRFIAFSSDGAGVPSGIFVMDAAGGGRRRLTRADTGLGAVEWATGAADGSPAWSPEGDRIAFVRTFVGPTSLAAAALVYTAASDGSGEPVRLPAGAWAVDGIDWAPDGVTVAVAGVAAGSTHAEVTLIGPSEQVELPTPGGTSHMVHPSVGPDGTRLAAAVFDINRTPSDVWVLNIDGTDPVDLTAHPAWDDQPAWQPRHPIPIGLVDAGTGQWFLRHPSGDVTTFYFGAPGDQPLLGDWDCDGIDTAGVYRPSDGMVYLRNSATTGVADRWFRLQEADGVVLGGDWDGDGCATIAVFRRGEVSIADTLPPVGGTFGADRRFWFGLATDRPFSGDFNGDGKDTVGLHRPAQGLVYLNEVAPSGPVASTDRQFWFGSAGDVVVAGNWTGAGADTVACFRPGVTGKLFFRFTNTTGPADREYFNFFATAGGSALVPVSGDFGLER